MQPQLPLTHHASRITHHAQFGARNLAGVAGHARRFTATNKQQ
jgi:hypothetical protein